VKPALIADPIHHRLVTIVMLCFLASPSTLIAEDWKNSQISTLKTRTTAAISNIDDVSTNLGPLNNLEEFVELINENRQALNGDALELLEQGRSQIELAILERTEGLEDFLGDNNCAWGSPCKQFKSDVTMLFGNIQQTAGSLLTLNPLNPAAIDIDLELFAELIDQAPGRVIYPLYIGMTSGSSLFEADLSSYFSLIAESLAGLREGLQASSVNTLQSSSLPTTDLPDRCPLIMEVITADRFQSYQRITFGASIFTKVVALIMKARGETGFTGMQLGVHGYIGGNLSNNRKKKIGLVIEGISDSLGMVAAHANNTLRYCTLVDNQRQLLEFVAQNQFPGTGPVTKSTREK
jgi:hypothetical protein